MRLKVFAGSLPRASFADKEGPASITNTLTPALARVRAAIPPVAPEPMTMTSNGFFITFGFDFISLF